MKTVLTLNSDVTIHVTSGDILVGCNPVRINGVLRMFVAVFRPARYLGLVKGRTVGDITITVKDIDDDISAAGETEGSIPVIDFVVNGDTPAKFPSLGNLMANYAELEQFNAFVELEKCPPPAWKDGERGRDAVAEN